MSEISKKIINHDKMLRRTETTQFTSAYIPLTRHGQLSDIIGVGSTHLSADAATWAETNKAVNLDSIPDILDALDDIGDLQEAVARHKVALEVPVYYDHTICTNTPMGDLILLNDNDTDRFYVRWTLPANAYTAGNVTITLHIYNDQNAKAIVLDQQELLAQPVDEDTNWSYLNDWNGGVGDKKTYTCTLNGSTYRRRETELVYLYEEGAKPNMAMQFGGYRKASDGADTWGAPVYIGVTVTCDCDMEAS